MAYVELNDLKGKLAADFLTQALDDNGDGVIDNDVWAAVQADVASAIDGRLAARFPVPLPEPLPAVVRDAAKILAMEQLYNRRGLINDKNPYQSQADSMRKRLERIAQGEEQMEPDRTPAKPPITVITEQAKTTLTNGGKMLA